MQDQPSAPDILAFAITHLRENLLPSLEPRAQFELRVTISALQLVQRQMTLAPDSDLAEASRLLTLLDESGELRALNERLSAMIREDALSLSTPGLTEHLRATAIEKLAVDQPTYSAYRRAIDS